MRTKIYYIIRFIKSTISNKGADLKTSSQLNKIAKECLGIVQFTERDDLYVEDFHSFIARILGVFTMIVSYHESITFLCLAKQSLNASILLRTQLEAHLILCHLINPSEKIEDVKERVHKYEDWVCIKMYQNSKKSKNFELFTISPQHSLYLENIETNYLAIKEKYINNPNIFRDLEKSQSFLSDKRTVAKLNGIEDLYLGIFTETSASVHLADISDRMIKEEDEDFDGYSYNFNSSSESMMMVGISNILLLKSITIYFDFLKIPKEIKKALLSKTSLARQVIKDN